MSVQVSFLFKESANEDMACMDPMPRPTRFELVGTYSLDPRSEDPHHLVDGADLGAADDLPGLTRTQIAMRLSWISRLT